MLRIIARDLEQLLPVFLVKMNLALFNVSLGNSYHLKLKIMYTIHWSVDKYKIILFLNFLSDLCTFYWIILFHRPLCWNFRMTISRFFCFLFLFCFLFFVFCFFVYFAKEEKIPQKSNVFLMHREIKSNVKNWRVKKYTVTKCCLLYSTCMQIHSKMAVYNNQNIFFIELFFHMKSHCLRVNSMWRMIKLSTFLP